MVDPIRVTETVHTFDKYSLEDNIDKVIAYLEKCKLDVPAPYRDTAHLDFDSYTDGYWDCSLRFHRPENEMEKAKRLEREELYKKSRRQQYENLKKEFGE